MPPLHIHDITHEISMLLLHMKNHFHSPKRKSLNILSSIARSLMIASNKQRQKHNNLVTIWREKIKGAHEHSKLRASKLLKPRIQYVNPNKNEQGSFYELLPYGT